MKLSKSIWLAMGLLAGFAASETALADPHHGHTSVGVYVGPGFYAPPPRFRPYWADPFYYPPYPYYAYPPVIVTPAPAPVSPPVYIEQAPQQQAPALAPQASAQQDNNAYWYHCSQPEGYYPYVKECPQGWQKVTPQPSTPPGQ